MIGPSGPLNGDRLAWLASRPSQRAANSGLDCPTIAQRRLFDKNKEIFNLQKSQIATIAHLPTESGDLRRQI